MIADFISDDIPLDIQRDGGGHEAISPHYMDFFRMKIAADIFRDKLNY